MAKTAAAFRTVIDRAPRVTVIGTIVIKDFENEMMVTKAGDCIESEVFTLKGEPFVVEVYTQNTNVYMRLSNRGIKEVFVESMKWTVCGEPGESKSRVGVKPCTGLAQAQAQALHRHSPAQVDYFYGKTPAQVKSLLKDGVFEVQVEVEVLGDRIVTSSTTSAQPSGSSNLWVLEQLFRDLPEGSDFSLVSEEGEGVPCHLTVLSGASPYFRGKWKEFKDSSSEVKCSTKVARNLVRFFYISRLGDSCLNGQEETFLRLADYYQVEELKMYVEARMLQVLERPNMVDFYMLGDAYKAKRIREAAKKFLRSNMAWLREQGEWKKAFAGEKNMGLLNEVLMELA